MLQAPAAPTQQWTKHIPHFLQTTPAPWDTRGSSHSPDIPGAGTAPGARGAEHTPCTIPCLPHTLPEAYWEQTNSSRGRIQPAAQDTPPCTNASTPMLAIPNCWVSSSTVQKRNKTGVSPFLAVSISSSVQRELSFISREAGKEEGKRAVSCEQHPASPVSSEVVSQHPNLVPCPVPWRHDKTPCSAEVLPQERLSWCGLMRLFHATAPLAQHPPGMHLSDAKPPLWAWKRSQMA